MKWEINALILKVQGLEEIGEAIRMGSGAMEPERGKHEVQRTAAMSAVKEETGAPRIETEKLNT
jgi:hypothetical protein